MTDGSGTGGSGTGGAATGGAGTGGAGTGGVGTGGVGTGGGRRARPVRVVVFDLDDTLVPQAAWLAGAWEAVAAAAAEVGRDAGIEVDAGALERALATDAGAGSARGGVIDRAVAAVAPGLPVAPLVDAFRSYRAPRLVPFEGAVDAVQRCRRAVPVGLVTDGDPGIQRAKLSAAGLADAFDAVVFSDELGRERRKPHPLPFRTVLAALDADPGDAAFVGDRPETDLAGAAALGMTTVRVRTGEYAAVTGDVTPDADLPGVVEAVAWLLEVAVAAR